MIRSSWLLLLGGLLAFPPGGRAADRGPAGTWKVTLLVRGGRLPFVLLKLDSKDKKWQGEVTAKGDQFEGARIKVAAVKVTPDALHMTFTVRSPRLTQTWTIEAKNAKGGKEFLGSVELPQGAAKIVFPVRLERTTLKDLGRATLAEEVLAKQPDSYEAFDATVTLLRLAEERQTKPAAVKAWAEKAFKNAAAYGPRWQRALSQRMAEALAGQKAFTPLALEYAVKSAKLMGANESAVSQMRTLGLVVSLLKKAKKDDEVKNYQGRIAQLEDKVHEEYARAGLPFKPDKFKGRKARSGRVVLVELFTGAQCPPCVASDLAFDGLVRTYQPTEVVLLQYHLHIPRPDALTNKDSEARRKYYIDDIEGTPSIFFNGKFDAPGGGAARDAEEKYKEYRGFIDPLLEKPAAVGLSLKVVRKGDQIDITAETSDLAKPGKHVRLRLALVEGWVKYAGFNQIPYHHNVVRAMPGGAEGLPLTKKKGRLMAAVDLAKLRKDLAAYLDNYAKKKKRFLDDQRPLDLRDLRVVAFVQNDDTKEVLQAVQVKVGGAPARKKGEEKKDGKDEKDKKERRTKKDEE
jgi:hypothetical protein